MNLGELILTLKPLLADATANSQRIVELLDRHRSLAEFEVARFYAGRAFAPVVMEQARSADPRERIAAARATAMILSRADAAKLLRRLVKDADPLVRSAARRSVRRLGLDDVALPDTRFKPGRQWRPNPLVLGGWNPSGWSFGLYMRARGKTKKPKGLPAIADVKALQTFLRVEDLAPLMRPGEGTDAPYVAFEIAKASGGKRTIHAPRKTLKTAQRKIMIRAYQTRCSAARAHERHERSIFFADARA
jgi:hypothetical protein